MAQQTGVYKFITDLGDVDAAEWDALITNRPAAFKPPGSSSPGFHGSAVLHSPARPKRTIPEHLFVMQIFDDARSLRRFLDNVSDARGNSRWLEVLEVPGSSVRAGDIELDDYLQDLRDDLVKVAEKRQRQVGARLRLVEEAHPDHPPIEVLALGPSDIALAGRYTRISGAATWFVPFDVSDFAPWWDAALRHWHTIDSEKFPDLPGWIERFEWLSQAEQDLATQIAAEEARFAAAKIAHDSRLRELRQQSNETADLSVKQLLVGTGTELQETVRDVLREFGYHVRDMDKEYREREPREDYRITEPGIDNWLVIGDATGVAKGAKSSKIMALARYTAHYEREERPSHRPRQWLLVNRLTAREPSSRGDTIFRDDDREQLVEALGLAIDTVALFVLHRALKHGTVSARQIRNLLRERSGELTWQVASEWTNTLLV